MRNRCIMRFLAIAFGRKELQQLLLQLSKSALGSYETNAHSPDNETLVLLADYYQVSVDYLLGRVSGKVDIGFFDKSYTAKESNGAVSNRISWLPQELKDMLADYLIYLESKRDKD